MNLYLGSVLGEYVTSQIIRNLFHIILVVLLNELLQTNMPSGMIMPRHIYETGNQCHSDIQMWV